MSDSLLSGLVPTPLRPGLRDWRLPDRAREWWSAATATRERRRNVKIAAGVLLVGLGVGAYFAFRPIPQPDYRKGRMDRVMRYTLLTDEFNNLPVQERMKLIGELIQRFREMDSQDSVLLASFAAGIAGAAREQLEQNASRLAIDMWDQYAKDYDTVKEDEREEYLEKTFVEFQKTLELMGGQPRDISDSERINEVRNQAKRDREAMRDPKNQPPPEAIGRMVSVMNRAVAPHADPAQRIRGAQMMRDMVRHFRGQDVSTGHPKPPGGG